MNQIALLSDYRQSPSYADSTLAAERRDMRRIIRGLPLSKNDAEILQYLVNLWFVHRNAKGYIHPGREKVAKKTRVSVRTVARAFEKFRRLGYIQAIRFILGGRHSTRYVVDFRAIVSAASNVKVAPGILAEIEYPDPLVRATRAENADKPCQFGTRLKSNTTKDAEKSGASAGVVRIDRSWWRGQGRTIFSEWVEASSGFSSSEMAVLRKIAENICPNTGCCGVSDRAIARETGLSRRAVVNALAVFSEESVLYIRVESRMKRFISAGEAMNISHLAPGRLF